MSTPCPEYGFRVTLALDPAIVTSARDALCAAFAAMLQARGLAADGRSNGDVWYQVVSRDGAAAVDADREAVRAWAAARPEITGVTIAPLADLGEADAT